MERWLGRTALVTGASSGIGYTVCRTLAQAGINVVAVARNIQPIQVLSRDMASAKGSIVALKCDLTRPKDIDVVFEEIHKRFGGIDVCVNNAGLSLSHSLLDGTPEEWRQMLDVNVISLCYCSKLAIDSMAGRKVEQGQIINISSAVAHTDKIHSLFNFYGATKHAVKFLTEGFRQEIAEQGHNIRVTAISPGSVATEFFQRALRDNLDVLQTLESSLPTLRPETIADAIIYILASPKEVQINDVLLSSFMPK